MSPRTLSALVAIGVVGAAANVAVHAQLRPADAVCLPAMAIETIGVTDIDGRDWLLGVPSIASVTEFTALPDGTRAVGTQLSLSSGRDLYTFEGLDSVLQRLRREGWE